MHVGLAGYETRGEGGGNDRRIKSENVRVVREDCVHSNMCMGVSNGFRVTSWCL